MKDGEPNEGFRIYGLIAVVVWSVLFFISLACDCGWAVVLCAIAFPLVCLFAIGVSPDEVPGNTNSGDGRSLLGLILGALFGTQFFDDD